MMDGKTVWNTESVIPKYNKFDTLVHLVGFTIEIYYDARLFERQNSLFRKFHQLCSIARMSESQAKWVSLLLRRCTRKVYSDLLVDWDHTISP